MALRAVWEPTIETNQRPLVRSSRAKASAVALKPPALMVNSSSGSMAGVASMVRLLSVWVGCGARGAGSHGRPPAFSGGRAGAATSGPAP